VSVRGACLQSPCKNHPLCEPLIPARSLTCSRSRQTSRTHTARSFCTHTASAHTANPTPPAAFPWASLPHPCDSPSHIPPSPTTAPPSPSRTEPSKFAFSFPRLSPSPSPKQEHRVPSLFVSKQHPAASSARARRLARCYRQPCSKSASILSRASKRLQLGPGSMAGNDFAFAFGENALAYGRGATSIGVGAIVSGTTYTQVAQGLGAVCSS